MFKKVLIIGGLAVVAAGVFFSMNEFALAKNSSVPSSIIRWLIMGTYNVINIKTT